VAPHVPPTGEQLIAQQLPVPAVPHTLLAH
jgi:hypothetical protein